MIPVAAFMVGLLGSMHCLAMCGPIAFALPVRTQDSWAKFYKYLLYNVGRMLSYGMLGVVVGLIGEGLVLSGVQHIVSVIAGLLLIVSALLVHNVFNISILNRFSTFVGSKVKSTYSVWFRKSGVFALFVLGILNGLLPCGMVYMALLGALGTGSVWSGFLFMVLFGLGTTPIMMAASFLGNFIGSAKNILFKKAMPIAACFVGILLIYKGVNNSIANSDSESKVVSTCCEIKN